MNYLGVLFISLIVILQVSQAAAQDNLQEGIQYFQQGEYEQAVSAFKEIIEQDAPQRVQAYYFLARTHGITGSFRKGHEVLEKALEIYPEHPGLRFARAELAGHTNPYAGAEIMHQLYYDEKDNPDLYYSLGLTPENLKEYSGQLYARAGSEFYGEEQIDRSIQALKKARELIPDSLYVHNNLIYTLLNNEQYDEAIEAAEYARDRFPENRNIRLMHNQALSLAGRGEDNPDDIQQLYRENPDDPQTAMVYGQALLNEGKAIEAAEHFEEFLKRNPRQRQVYRMLIQINQRQFEYEGLAEVLKMKVEAFPREPNIRAELAEVLALIDKFQEARAHYAHLYDQTEDPYYILEKVRTYLSEEKWEEAEHGYRALCEDYPASGTGRMAAGELIRLYNHLEKTAKALETAESAYTRYEHSSEIAVLYLQQLRNNEQLQKAAELAEKLIDMPGVRSGIPYLIIAEISKDPAKKRDYLEKVMHTELEEVGKLSEQIRTDAQAALEGGIEMQIPVLNERTQLEQHRSVLNDAAAIINDTETPANQVEIYQRLHEQYDSNIWVKQQIAGALIRNGKTTQAEEVLLSAARLNPDDVEIHQETAELFEQSGNDERAIISWERALGTDQKNEPAYRNLIRLHRKKGTLEDLCDRWMAQYRANPDNEILKEYLIDALHRAGRSEEARAIAQGR